MKNIDKLINLINKENLFPNLSHDNFEDFFNIYLLSCDIAEIDETFICLQDEYLKSKYKDCVVDFKSAKKGFDSPLDIDTDLLIVFSENVLIDAYAIYNNCKSIDNELIVRGGVGLKECLYQEYEQDRFVLTYKRPYIIGGHNLQAKTVVKILVDNVSESNIRDEKILKSIDGLREWLDGNKINNCVIYFDNVTKNNKIVKKHLKNTLKSNKIKEIIEIL